MRESAEGPAERGSHGVVGGRRPAPALALIFAAQRAEFLFEGQEWLSFSSSEHTFCGLSLTSRTSCVCLVPLVPPVGGLASATRSGGFPFLTVSYRWLLDRVSSQSLLSIVALNRVLVKTVGLCFWSGDSSISGAPTSVVTCMCHF